MKDRKGDWRTIGIPARSWARDIMPPAYRYGCDLGDGMYTGMTQERAIEDAVEGTGLMFCVWADHVTITLPRVATLSSCVDAGEIASAMVTMIDDRLDELTREDGTDVSADDPQFAREDIDESALESALADFIAAYFHGIAADHRSGVILPGEVAMTGHASAVIDRHGVDNVTFSPDGSRDDDH